MRVTLKDIASRLRVTKTTVSLALRNSGRLSAERRRQIHQVAHEMGYAPDPFLSRLSMYRAGSLDVKAVGVIAWLNRWEQPKRLRAFREFDLYFRGALDASRRLGYRLEEVVWPADVSAEEFEDELADRSVLGLLIPPHPPNPGWQELDWNRFSLIRFGLSVPSPDSNVVTADHQCAMVMAVRRIHEYGYGRLGLVFDRVHDRAMGGNYSGGFQWAHRSLGIRRVIAPLDLQIGSPGGIAAARRNLVSWLKKFKPDAILTTIAEVPAFLREFGYRIPGDIAVASTSRYDIPIEAGIDQRPKAIGEIAAEMLIKQITLNERGVPEDPCRILVESRWRDGPSLPRKA